MPGFQTKLLLSLNAFKRMPCWSLTAPTSAVPYQHPPVEAAGLLRTENSSGRPPGTKHLGESLLQEPNRPVMQYPSLPLQEKTGNG